MILASRKPLTISELYDAVWTSNISLTRQEFSKRLHLLRRVVRLNSDGTVLLFHHSFGEWLLDAKHCTRKYLCSSELGHGMLAMSLSLKAKQLNSEDIQNFALHLTRMPLPEESVLNFMEKTLGFDYNTLLVLWLIQSGANVENCLLGQEKKDSLISYFYSEADFAPRKKSFQSDSTRKKTSSLGRKDQRGKLPKYENYEARKKSKSRKHSSLKRDFLPVDGIHSLHYEKLQECYEELKFEPYGRRDLDKEKRISEDYDHLDFDLKKPENKVSETNELLEQFSALDFDVKKNELQKSPDLLKDFTDQSFKFSLVESPAKNTETIFLKLDSHDSGFLKSEDTSTLGVRSDGQTTLSSTNEEKAVSEYEEASELTREEELDMLLNGLEKSLNEETHLLDESFLSQITQNSLIGLRKDLEEKSPVKDSGESGFGNDGTKSDKDFSAPSVNQNEIINDEKTSPKEGEVVKYEEEEGVKETEPDNIFEILQVPRDPKVLKILTEAGAKMSNCNSLQRDGKSTSLEGGIDGIVSSQVSLIISIKLSILALSTII